MHRTLVPILALAVFAGCYRPQGPMMNFTGAAHTFNSTETQPKTVQLIDLRTRDIVFEMDIPPGKALVLDFVDGAGDDDVYTPDRMRYQVFDIGTSTGKLRNALSVPAASSRRIEVSLRPGPEYRPPSPERALRTDELIDRPDWWTPRGGELPEDPVGLTTYDD